ncbi:MAG: chorismate-binding protein [Spirosomataceae bacterium]
MSTLQEISSSTAFTTAHFWEMAQAKGLPSALWRLPNGQTKHLIVDLSGSPSVISVDLEETPPGFALSPFLNPDNNETLFIKADIHVQFSIENQLLKEEEIGFEKRVQIDDFLNTPATDSSFQPEQTAKSKQLHPSSDEKSHYTAIVEEAVKRIHQGEFQKVVLSRTKQIPLPTDFDINQVFDQLCEAYPNAFVSAVWLPEQGEIWLGATPETLVSVDSNGMFRTISLAGTQSAYREDRTLLPLSEARWTQKEIEEQALVSRYIVSCFKRIRLREYIENGPKTARAGNLIHLRTDFLVDTKAVNFPQLGTAMLQLLHPTSAVCGTPKQPALEFILENENYHRDLYSGFLGPVNIEFETHLFVNLRTMKVGGDNATLFAGAGITEDSIPEKEWNETEMKCQTLLSVILPSG